MALTSLTLLDFITFIYLTWFWTQIYNIINSLTWCSLFLIPEQKNTSFTELHFLTANLNRTFIMCKR